VKQIKKIKCHEDWINTISFIGNINSIATGSSDHSIKIFSLTTNDVIKVLEGHND